MLPVKIVIGGDLVPTKSNKDFFELAKVVELFGEDLLAFIQYADFRIFNLEVPLTDQETPIPKCGHNLIAPTSTIRGIKALNPSLISLANNHVLDQGEQGLKSTEYTLRKYGIPYIGAGKNLDDACQPHLFERDGIRIGVYACTEYEFSIATNSTPGANPFDPFESLDHIAALKTQCDYVIVIYHGGKEHYRYPSPYLRKVCRKMSQKGADLVICQHSHCIGCYEEYKGSTIVYGQGNFLFDGSDSEFWQTSLLIKVNISDGLKVEYIPIKKTGNSTTMISDTKAEDILKAFCQRSEDITQDGFVERQYNKFVQENIKLYLYALFGFGKWMSMIDMRLMNSMLLKRKCSKTQFLTLRNYIECEAHRESLLVGLKDIKY